MKREKIRLRPTGLWVLFGPVLGCMWLAAVNYSNNLVYGILYLIGALTFVSLFHTWRNLASLEAGHVRVHSAFAGGMVRVEITFRNAAQRPVYGLFFVRLEEGKSWRGGTPLVLPGGGNFRVQGGDSQTVELLFPAGRRGSYRFDSLLVRTSYPFGLVTASFRLHVGVDYFIYPEAKGNPVLPELRPSANEAPAPTGPGAGDDFAGVRLYLPGESWRHVDWKAYARGRPLSVKQFAGGDGVELLLDASELAELPLEERLSQISLWVMEAEREEIPYALRVGKTFLATGLGSEQRRRALEALAVAGDRL
jgi:uncharacterized protein (DUF58 family)